MNTMRRIASLISWVWIVASPAFCQANGKPPLNVRVDKNTIVRIFYLPPESYLHPPLIFRVAGENDPSLGNAPINLLGRTSYISLSEMRNLVTAFADWNLSWQKSKKLETPKQIEPREMTDKMEVKVFSSRGTDRVLLDPNRLCERLAPLDAALKQPRALWEFQLFRVDYGCHVQGFDRNAFPEHDDPKAGQIEYGATFSNSQWNTTVDEVYADGEWVARGGFHHGQGAFLFSHPVVRIMNDRFQDLKSRFGGRVSSVQMRDANARRQEASGETGFIYTSRLVFAEGGKRIEIFASGELLSRTAQNN